MSTQLTYAVSTNPDPLQVRHTNATLSVVGSIRRPQLADITSITISIPVGSGSQALVVSGSAISAKGPDGWQIDSYPETGVFTFIPPRGNKGALASGLAFQFLGLSINHEPGTANVNIAENDDIDGLDLPVSKFPAEFFLDPLTVNPAQINAGETATLAWRGSPGYRYDITPHDLLSQPITPESNQGGVQTKPLLQNTIFTLSVSNGNNTNAFVTQKFAGVTVDPPTISDFRINQSTAISDVGLNEPLALSWTTTNADNVVIWAENTVVGLFDAAATDATLPALVSGTYRAVAIHGEVSAGVHSPLSRPVTVRLAPPMARIAITPDDVYADYALITLDWATKNATSAKLQSGSEGGDFSVALNATDFAVYPQHSLRYRLKAIYDQAEALSRAAVVGLKMPATTRPPSATTMGHISTAEATAPLTMKPCPLQVIKTTLKRHETGEYPLTGEGNKAVSFISGFHYPYEKNENHKFSMWRLEANASLKSAGTVLKVESVMVLHDTSAHTLGPDATLDLVTVCVDKHNQSCLLKSFHPPYDVDQFRLPGGGYRSIATGMTKFAAYPANDKAVKPVTLGGYVEQPDLTDAPYDPEDDSTTVTIPSTSISTAKQYQIYYDMIFAALCTKGRAGSGFGTVAVTEGTQSVHFPQRVEAAYTFLSEWISSGDGKGKEHSISALISDVVRPQVADQTVHLEWGRALWDDASHGPWVAERKIIVLALYGDKSVTVPPLDANAWP